MYRVSMLIMLKDTWKYIKNEKQSLFLYVILEVIVLQSIVSGLKMARGQEVVTNMGETDIKILILVCAVFSFGFLFLLMGKIPLCICKGIYVCPAGEREKLVYLAGTLLMRVGIGMLLGALALKFFIGTAFWGGDIVFMVILYVLCFFTFIAVALNLRMGDTGERRVDENGYAIQTKEEIAIKVYWMCILLVQWVLLFADTASFMTPVVRGCVWGICLLLNLFFVVKYVRTFLKEILLYENTYCRRPKREEVQYDIC